MMRGGMAAKKRGNTKMEIDFSKENVKSCNQI